MRTYKYRIYPSKSQRRKLQGALDACRWVYNQTLEVRKTAWEERKESLSLYDTQKLLTVWKAEHEWLAEQAHSQVLQNTSARVDLAFKAFFRRLKAGAEKVGYPRFRGVHRYASFTFPQSGFRILENGRLRLSKVGDVKIKQHQPICNEIKTLTVRRDALGNWWVTFACAHKPEYLPPSGLRVGIDVGLTHFLTTDQGQCVDNPRFFRKEELALAKVQRQLSKHKIGSPRWLKKKRVIQHLHKRITNMRHNFIHQLSRAFVNKYQIIALEKLDIQDMQDCNTNPVSRPSSFVMTQCIHDWVTGRSVLSWAGAGRYRRSAFPDPEPSGLGGTVLHRPAPAAGRGETNRAGTQYRTNWVGMNKSIGDAAWGMFAQATKYKAAWAGRSFVQVNPRDTTQLCSGADCHKIVKKDCNYTGTELAE